MGITRTIRCQYYQIKLFHKKRDGRKMVKVYDGKFDFPSWAKSLRDKGIIKQAVEFNNVIARVEKIGFKDGIWGLRIMKLRDTNIPVRAKDGEEARTVELDENEYIGEDLFMIYDKETGIAMIQQNRMSLGLSRIEEFLQYTYDKYTNPKNKSRVSIEPIAELERGTRLKGNYRQLELSFANLRNFVDEGNTALSTILKPFKNMYGVTGKIKIGLGRTQSDSLNRTEIDSLASELSDYSNKRYIRSAKVTLQEEDDSDVEIVDLFEENCHDFINLEYEEREMLDYNLAISKMRSVYLKRKDELNGYT